VAVDYIRQAAGKPGDSSRIPSPEAPPRARLRHDPRPELVKREHKQNPRGGKGFLMHDEPWWTDVETFRAATAIDALAESKLTFTTHCPIGSDFMERCHNFGLHSFPYVTFYVGSDDVQWGPTHFDAYEGVEFGMHKFYEIDANGSPKPSPFGSPTSDGVGVLLNHCYITCPNVLEYQDKMNEWVEYIMGLGADGVFVDNLFARQPCFGARLGIHPHTFPDPPDPD
jgi:hypothetical protein